MKESLRIKIFRMNMILIIAALVLSALHGVIEVRRYSSLMEETNRTQNTVIMDTLSESLEDMAAQSYQKYVITESRVIDGEFWTMRHDLEVLARQVQTVLEEPSAYSSECVSVPSVDNAGTLTAQLLYSDNADKDDPVLQEQAEAVSSLKDMMLEIIRDGETMQDCIVSLPGGASILVDASPENKINADGEAIPYNFDRRPWYVGALVHGETYFSPVSRDNYQDEYEVMAGVPVYIDGELAAVCGGSVFLDRIGESIEDAKLGEHTDSAIINENGNLIFSTRKDGELGMTGSEIKSVLESSNPEFVSLVNEAMKGEAGFSLVQVDGKDTYIAYAPIETLGWTQLLSISREDLNETAYLLADQTDSIMEDSLSELHDNESRVIYTTLGIAAIMILCAAFLSLIFSNRLVNPIKRMTLRISEMQGDDMSFEVEDVLLTGDEIEVLARAFANMSEKMKGYVSEIVEITSEKQRLDTELSVASDIQTNMLPMDFPAFPWRKEFDLYAVMDPAKEVGGDFYDFFLIDGDHLAVVMADVSGKGVPAALFMVVAKTMIKNAALSGQYTTPADILTDVNDALCEGNKEDMFVTVWLGILTISTGEILSACAGHEYPVFYRRDRGFVLERDHHDMAIGGFEGIKYRNSIWHLAPGDMLFLYTDGVPEANNSHQELFGTSRMMDALDRSMQAVREGDNPEKMDLKAFLCTMRTEIDSFAGDTPQFDDLTMLCLSYYGGPEEEDTGGGLKGAAEEKANTGEGRYS